MEPNVFDKVHEVDLKKTMEQSYIDYAMSVISARALPDVRDGLKPVQRRVLFSIREKEDEKLYFNYKESTYEKENITLSLIHI